jgi:organic radical activating enzyme
MGIDLKKNKSFCIYAFKEIYSDSHGRYGLCCHARPWCDTSTRWKNFEKWQGKKYGLEDIRTQNTTPFKYFLSPEMEKIRNKMLAGERIDNCKTCHDMEDKGFRSYRKTKYPETSSSDISLRNIALKLRITGSYCNLGCYMCFPYNSYTRRKELDAVYGSFKKSNEDFKRDYKGVNYSQWNECLDDIIKNTHLVKHMGLSGGEPLLLPNHWKLIDAIPKDDAKLIALYYDTNLTHLTYKKYSIFDVSKKFKSVSLGVSCDHFGKKLDWIRYPIDRKKFEANLKEAKDLILQLNCSVSLLNIFDLEEIYDYYLNNFGIQTTFHNIVRGPLFLSIRNLSKDIKDSLKEKYKHSRIITGNPKEERNFGLNPLMHELSLNSIPGYLERSKKYCDDLSKHRNFNWRDLWNEY